MHWTDKQISVIYEAVMMMDESPEDKIYVLQVLTKLDKEIRKRETTRALSKPALTELGKVKVATYSEQPKELSE